MKKIFGIEAEINITTDDDVAKGIGKGLSKGAISLKEIFDELKPEIIKSLKDFFKEKENKNGK